jgi:ABC-type methionine transport system ATPase subunit
MPAKPKKKAARAKKPAEPKIERSRLWLMFPQRLITRPVVWELGKKYNVTTNVRQASVTGEIGIVCLELEGVRKEIKTSIAWLEKQGVSVEPVEINIIES